jgi:putative DNA primase/helicase
MVAVGRRAPVSILSPEPEEQRKALFALALEGHRAVLLDNITRPLGGGVLSAIVTSGEVRDRVLSVSRTASAEFRAVLLATGNNLRFVGDFDRRVLVAREPAGGFLHADLRAHVAEEHPRLVAAVLTVLRAWHVAGRPGHGSKAFGSFEGWDGVVRAASVWAGIGDPLACRDRVRDEADADRDRIQALHAAWIAAFGRETATVAQAAERSKVDAGLRAALAAFDSKGSTDHLNTRSLGQEIGGVVGRIVAGERLERASKKSPAPYRVVAVGSVASVASATSFADTRARVAGGGGDPLTEPTEPTQKGAS